MAFTVRNLKDTDFETVVLVLITGTNGTATEVVDASGLAGPQQTLDLRLYLATGV